MKQKIEWYKEVLELEPGSRVFFPLAKLLAADGQTADAVHFLQQGLLRHPDHVEARLLLVELLFLQDAEAELQAEIDRLGALFASYPGFWKAWSERLSAIPAMRDASLAMRFFAAAMQGKKVSWGEIIEQGIQTLLGSDAGAASFSPAFAAPRPSAQEESAMRRSAPASFEPPRQDSPEREISASPNPFPEVAAPADTVPVPALAAPADEEPVPAAPDVHAFVPDAHAALEEGEESAEDEESEETFSIRTRSMAEVLAEQGDLSGALEIYNELMETAAPDERTSLKTRADELSQRMSSGPSSDVGRVEEKAKAPGGESTRLVGLLESLAQRLEARAR